MFNKKISILIFMLCILTFLSACTQSMQTNWQEQYDLGARYLSEGNYEEAIIAFTAAIEIDSKNAVAYVGRGDAYIGLGETEENLALAKNDYETAIELDESNAEAYLGLADVYIRQCDYEKALEILKQGLEKTSNSQNIADKIAEMESGIINDAYGNTRRSLSYSANGELKSYIDYYYDELGRKSSWDIFSLKNDNYIFDKHCDVVFNENNLPDKYYFYDKDNTLTSYDTFEYNDKMQKIKQYRYNESGELRHFFIFYYDENGRNGRYESYNADGKLEQYWLREYNANGELTKSTRYKTDGTLGGYTDYE